MTENKSNKMTKADEMAKIQEHIFEREVDEELRQERLNNFWKKYRFLIIGGAIGVVLVTIAHEWYGAWQQKVRGAESDRLEKALVMAVKGNEKTAMEQLKKLGDDGKTGYRYIAQMEEVGLLFKQNKYMEALSVLETLSKDTKAPKQIRDLAVVSYVGNLLDTGDTQKLKQLVKPLVQDKTGAFYGQAVELMAWLYLISGEKQEAKSFIEQAVASDNLAPGLKERLTLLSEQKAQ